MMLIREITEASFDQEKNSPGIAFTQDKYLSKGMMLGKGAYGTTYKPKQAEIGHVAKVAASSTFDLKDDGYYQWIKAVLSAPSNRYLPQVIKATVKKPKHDEPYLDVKLERLYPASLLTSEGINFIADQIFKVPKGALPRPGTWKLSNILAYLEDYARGEEERGGPIVVDKDMIAALKLVVKAKSKSKIIEIDIHYENVMIRVTPYGPQLVITDPLN